MLHNPFVPEMAKETAEYSGSQLVKMMLEPLCTTWKAHVRLDIGGLWKSFGYPLIDSDQSARNLMKDLKTPSIVDAEAAQELRDVWLYMFCKEYYRVHKSWPPVCYTGPIKPDITESISSNGWVNLIMRDGVPRLQKHLYE